MTQLGNVYRITAHMTFNGVIDMENVYYVKVDEAGTDTDADVLDGCAAWLDNAYQEVASNLSNLLTFTDIRGMNITTDAPMAPVAWPTLAVGGSSVDPLATGVAAIITFYTLVSKVRGRKFIGGLNEGNIAGAVFNSGMLSLLISFAIVIAAGPDELTGGTRLSFGIYRKSKPFLPISRFVCTAIPGYQRRRRLSVGS